MVKAQRVEDLRLIAGLEGSELAKLNNGKLKTLSP